MHTQTSTPGHCNGLIKKMWTRVLLCLLTTLSLFSSFVTLSSATEQQRRISIAISGGASKGAYEAGLNWGLLKILRNIDRVDSSLAGQSHKFDAASFSGASAGGINTLLSSLIWCSLPQSEGGLVNRIDSNIFRNVWLRPDVNRLLPPKADSIYYKSNDALLARHDLLEAASELRQRWNTPSFRAGCRVPLGVTVTRVIPDEIKVGNIDVQNQRLFIPFEARTEKDGTLGFYFDPDDFPTLSDPAMILMPRAIDAPPYSINDQRIEDAVMTSAAFPGGFGRKRLSYCRLTSFIERDKEKTDLNTKAVKPSTKFVCPEGYELTEAEFSDGGLFDNLPIGLARQLAEQHKNAKNNTMPVTYIFLDPNRLRYPIPPPTNTTACASDNPPDACRKMEYSLFTEQALLLGALSTARKYELYSELTSDYWSLNLAQLSYELADKLDANKNRYRCEKDIPFYRTKLTCAEAVRRAGALLELVYTRASLLITPPYSAKKLRQAGVAQRCHFVKNNSTIKSQEECEIDASKYRKRLTIILLNISENNKQITNDFIQRIHQSKHSMHNDRNLRLTNRGAPITGTLLSDFGAFLDVKFREYDYYVGVYDSVIIAAKTLCGLKFSEQQQKQPFLQCQNAFAEKIHQLLGIKDNLRSRYIFSRLAQWEFGKQETLQFAYASPPEEDRDMRIIFDGLLKTLEAGQKNDIAKQGLFFTEDTFFLHLDKENFKATATENGSRSLLSQIIADPTKWSSELSRRVTTRIVYLEQQAKAIYTAREPDPEKRETSNSTIMGMAAHTIQTATYNYPDFTFAPSTAPQDWIWRNIIPYEFAFDLAESDLLFSWQPTWSLTKKDLVAARASLGFAGGTFSSSDSIERENYGALGLSYIRQTNSGLISSWGLTPTWYHQWSDPKVVDQDTLGGDMHVSFFKDRLRVGLGARDFNRTSDTWFITIGLSDLPGLGYWLTR